MGSKIINLVILIIGSICAFTFMKLTYQGFQSTLIQKHFSTTKLDKNDDAKMTLYFKFGLYFAIYTITLKILSWILSDFDKCKDYTATIQRIILNSYDYFIICFLLLFYLIRNKSNWNIKQKAPFYGYWFISGRIIYAVGYLLTTLTGLNLKVPGVAMIYFLISLMISDAFNFNGFQAFDLLPSLYLEL